MIVFYQVNDRQIPETCKIGRLVKRALGNAAISEEGDDNVAVALALLGEGRAGRQGNASTDDGIGAEHSGFLAAQVHGSTPAAAIARCESHDLGQGMSDRLVPGIGKVFPCGIPVSR